MEPEENGDRSGEQGAGQMDEQEVIERETRARWESLRPSYNEWAATSGESLSEFDRIVEGQVESARVNYQKARASRELDDSSVIWDRVTPEDCASLRGLLDSDPQEAEVHRFLEDNPKFLIQVLGTGHGRFQLSKPRFGAELIPDFLVAEMSSIGIEWHLVEIESPRCPVQRQDGLPTSELNHATGQMGDWRHWLMDNLDYARRSKDQNGLGLVGIDPRASGLVIIGRRQEYSARYNEIRRRMIDRERIVIHSYDWLVDVAQSNNSGWLTSELR